MIGSIIGDIIGSIYEDGTMKNKQFPLWNANCHFTDDTVLSIATADWLLNGGKPEDYYYSYVQKYPSCGYGTGFLKWAFIRKHKKRFQPYNSFGNGSAMRVGPVGWAGKSIDEVLKLSRESAICTHNHEEGIRGAQAIACCVFLAKNKTSKEDIRCFIKKKFDYDISRCLKDVNKDYEWNATCQGTVPHAIISFMESVDFEDSIRNAIALGGDSDTIACMTGSISEAFYGVPNKMRIKAIDYLPQDLKDVINKFEKQFGYMVI